MSKGIGEKLLGLFIEEDVEDAAPEAAPPRSPEDPAAKTSKEARAERSTARPPLPPPVVTPGAVHDGRSFTAVYQRAGLPDSDRERLAKVIGLVETLPSEASPEVKRAIVGASLEAFGVPIEGVVHTGNGALAALDAYVIEGQRRTQEVLGQAEARIAKLSAEIEEVRRLMTVQAEAQQELVRSTATERARVRSVLDFFDGARGASADGASSASANTASLSASPDPRGVPRLRRIS
ncbi:MAG: hypothetical protein JST00_38325 [Deltaproteobacteria bacterium]|nr:hypothetical protein [Deltaproteobacteria bacterium]